MFTWLKQKIQEREIQKLEAKLFCKTLECFHNQSHNGTECSFWNDMCGIRKEYLDELEKIK